MPQLASECVKVKKNLKYFLLGRPGALYTAISSFFFLKK